MNDLFGNDVFPMDFSKKARRKQSEHRNRKRHTISTRRWRKENPDRVNAVRKEWRDRNRQQAASSKIRCMYKISDERWASMLKSQNNKCAICGDEFTEDNVPHVDHDHGCCPGQKVKCGGKCIRDLLCDTCNRAEGIVIKHPKRLTGLIAYYKKWVKGFNLECGKFPEAARLDKALADCALELRRRYAYMEDSQNKYTAGYGKGLHDTADELDALRRELFGEVKG